jgi:hypothetical protein
MGFGLSLHAELTFREQGGWAAFTSNQIANSIFVRNPKISPGFLLLFTASMIESFMLTNNEKTSISGHL